MKAHLKDSSPKTTLTCHSTYYSKEYIQRNILISSNKQANGRYGKEKLSKTLVRMRKKLSRWSSSSVICKQTSICAKYSYRLQSVNREWRSYFIIWCRKMTQSYLHVCVGFWLHLDSLTVHFSQSLNPETLTGLCPMGFQRYVVCVAVGRPVRLSLHTHSLRDIHV